MKNISILHIRNKYKKVVIALAALLLLFFASFYDEFYQKTIVQVTSVDENYVSEKEGVNGQLEKCYEQKMTGVIQNSSLQGTKVDFTNEYSESETDSIEYGRGDKIFVNLKELADGTYQVTLLYPKRDSYLFLFAGIFVLLLMFLFHTRGFMTLLSTGINVAFFFFCLPFYQTQAFIDWIWMVEVVFFVVVTLLFVSGIHKKTMGAILASLVTVLIVSGLFYVAVYRDSSISYEMMENYVPNLQLNQIFMISTIIGALGAIMDIAITINSSVSELVATTPEVTVRSLVDSIIAIGHDTMGTMVNVLFFSYLSGTFPLVVLKFSNNYSIQSIMSIDYYFDMIRFLVGSIGIVLAIPISGLISVLLFRKGLVKMK